MSKKPVSFWKVGDCVFIRTVTLYYVGRVVGFSDTEILLEEASWIADTGRFMQALTTGSLSEVEPYPELLRIHGIDAAAIEAAARELLQS